jgi:nitroreductase
MNNQVLDNMKARRSCRAFSSQMPERALLEKICEAGTWAPTGHGKQSPLIVAITNKSLRDRLSAMNARIWNELTIARGGVAHEGIDPFYGAPVVLLVLADRSVPTYLYDGCAVLTNMANAAEAVGLASCWIHRAKQEFDSEEGKQILKELGINGDYEGIDHLVVGYPSKPIPSPLPRKTNYIRWAE